MSDCLTTSREDGGVLLHVHQVTKYDPADRDEHGHYTGAEDIVSDHGAVESAYLAAAAAFAEDSGITHLTIHDPGVTSFVNFGLEVPVEGHGLAGLFPPDLTGYHDGARVTLDVGLGLVRAMLRDNGAWCRLEADDRFFVHVGWDQYMYVGSAEPCTRAIAHTRSLGLFPERLVASPYDPSLDEPAEPLCPADDEFWAELTALATQRGTVLLEERYVNHASRWHRLRPTDIAVIRPRLTPRAWLLAWPDLSADVAGVLAALPSEGLVELVWEDEGGRITTLVVHDELFPRLPALLAEASAAMVLSVYADDDDHSLLSAVLPDDDGVVRARWGR
jgi:hypothetical protein